jgi:NAD-dependent deacetylase
MTDVDELARTISSDASGRLLVVTGAGISLASGIPTFRGSDPGAIWSRDVTELGTNRYFEEAPANSWSWYLSRFGRLAHVEPNPGHHALAALERWHVARGGNFLLVTQNVDRLHAAAGSESLVEVHGRADRVRCSRRGCELGAPTGSIPRADVPIEEFLANPIDANVPRCPACDANLRQHVLWFDERYIDHADYQWTRVRRGADTATLVIFVGTSFAVGITEYVLEAALERHAPVFSIDPGGLQPDPRVRVVRAASEEVLPAIVAALGAKLASA